MKILRGYVVSAIDTDAGADAAIGAQRVIQIVAEIGTRRYSTSCKAAGWQAPEPFVGEGPRWENGYLGS